MIDRYTEMPIRIVGPHHVSIMPFSRDNVQGMGTRAYRFSFRPTIMFCTVYAHCIMVFQPDTGNVPSDENLRLGSGVLAISTRSRITQPLCDFDGTAWCHHVTARR
jgi:hypothetical protein